MTHVVPGSLAPETSGAVVEKKKRRRPIKGTERTLERLRRTGYMVQVVEKYQARFNPKPGQPPGVRIDLFGFIDVLAVTADEIGCLGVQSTNETELQRHVDKLFAPIVKTIRKKRVVQPAPISKVIVWLKAGNRFEIWGWGRRAGSSEKRTRVALFVRTVTLQGDAPYVAPAERRD